VTRLLRLYPGAWRDRYGDELVALLEEHPATALELFDLMRGALDAHLHPQVRGSGAAAPDKEIPVNQRILGAMAAIGGLVWIVGIVSTYLLPLDVYGERDTSLAVWGVAIGAGLIGIALGELGTRPGSASWPGHAIAIASISLGVTVLLGWPWLVIGLTGLPLMVMLGAARAYQTDALPGRAVAALGVASVTALVGVFGFTGGPLYAAIGVAGLVLAVMAFRSIEAPPAAEHPA